MRGKLWLLVLVLVAGGAGLVYMGAREVVDNRKLAADGKRATATVISKRERPLLKNKKSLHVTMAFQTEAGQKIQDERMVTSAVYASATEGNTLHVIYHPKNPSVFIIGGAATVNYTKFGLGWVFLGLGVLVFWFLRKYPTAGEIKTMTEAEMLEEARPAATEGAQKIVQQMAALTQAKHEYETVDAKSFPHLDLEFYDRTQRTLEAKGYVHLEDFEDVTLRKGASNPNTFLRAMLGGHGQVMAAAYHFKPTLLLRAVGAKECKVLDLETQFSNGHFVCTSNAEDSGKLNLPAEVDSLAMPRGTTPEMLLTTHEQRTARLMEKTGAHPVRMQSMADVRRAQDELQRLKAEFRQRSGLSRQELENLGAKKGDQATDLMFEEIMKEHQRVQGKKTGAPALG